MLITQIRARLRALGERHFIRAVGVLAGGTVLAQSISAVTLLVTTRLFSPGDFSVLAVFGGLTSVISVAACLRFDVAVALPEDDADAMSLLVLALAASGLLSTAFGVSVWLCGSTVLRWSGRPELWTLLWMLPLGVFIASAYTALQFWFLRRRAFQSIAYTRVAQAGAGAAIQLGSGWLGAGALGLIGGYMTSVGAGAVGLAWRLWREDHTNVRAVTVARMRQLFKSYDRFPRYSALEALANSASMQIPIVLIAGFALGPEAGYLWLAMYAIQAPMGLVGTAIGQVYMSRAPEQFRSGNLPRFTSEVLGGLLRSGIGPLIFIGLVAPDLFALVFRPEWRRSGELVSWMTPWFMLQFVSAPISLALHVTGHQRIAMILQMFGLVLRVSAVLVAASVSPRYLSEAYALSGLTFYFLYAWVILVTTGCTRRELMPQLSRALPILLVWLAAGVATDLVAYGLRLQR